MIHTLLIDCPDDIGLVHKATGVLYRHSLNVTSNNEYVDATSKRFFMRTEIFGDMDAGAIKQELSVVLPDGANITITTKAKKRIVILVTKEHHCLAEILIRHKFNELNAEIIAVIGNHDVLSDITTQFGIPFIHISHEQKSRKEHEEELLQKIHNLSPEFIVLAKYMRILSSDFVAQYSNRIINIHHSFLPAFVGSNPYRQAYERGVKIIGATAHFVNELLDEGPIIVQNVIPTDHTHSAYEMSQMGRDVEKLVLAKSLKLVFEDRVFVFDNKTIIFD